MKQNEFKQFKLQPEIIKALDNLHYFRPTTIQEESIDIILSKQDLHLQSKTGSGKSAALAIPIVEMINVTTTKPQCIIIVPTRDLARQLVLEIKKIGLYKGVNALMLSGKEDYQRQKQLLKQRNHIIVATPGRLVDHYNDHNISLDEVRYFVLDEADELLKEGFSDEINIIRKALKQKQTILLSATKNNLIDEYVSQYMHNPIILNSYQAPEEPILINTYLSSDED
ncbi:MAG: DEAD/DEAH box helicase family protein, partial [Bacilli bacterium]